MSNWKVKETEVNGKSVYFVYRIIDGTKPDMARKREKFANADGRRKLFKHRADELVFAYRLNMEG